RIPMKRQEAARGKSLAPRNGHVGIDFPIRTLTTILILSASRLARRSQPTGSSRPLRPTSRITGHLMHQTAFLFPRTLPLNRALVVLCLIISSATWAGDGIPQPPGKPYNPTIAPASSEAERAIRSIRVPAGLKIELFAAEPLLANPVAFC